MIGQPSRQPASRPTDDSEPLSDAAQKPTVKSYVPPYSIPSETQEKQSE